MTAPRSRPLRPGRLSHSVFAAVADPTRRQLLDLLARGEQPASNLARPFAMSRPAVSQHLAVLRQAGLVAARRVGRERRYRLRPAPLREVYDWVSHYERFWKEKLKALREYLDRTAGRKEQPPAEPPSRREE